MAPLKSTARSNPKGQEARVARALELVELSGYFRKWVNTAETADGSVSDDDDKISLKSCMSLSNSQVNCVLIKSVLHYINSGSKFSASSY